MIEILVWHSTLNTVTQNWFSDYRNVLLSTQQINQIVVPEKPRHCITLFFYKNIFYKNIKAEICEILRIS